MSTYIGFNLNSNRQIEHFQTIENRYGINSDGRTGLERLLHS